MVNYQNALLDRTFAALADPTRRALLARLDDEDGISVSELARPFPVSLPAIMKHLDVLSDAGLIARTKSGRTVTCQLKAAPMEQAMNWLAHYERYWTEQLDRLAEQPPKCGFAHGQHGFVVEAPSGDDLKWVAAEQVCVCSPQPQHAIGMGYRANRQRHSLVHGHRSSLWGKMWFVKKHSK